MKQGGAKRVMALEGLRGLAAISVVLYHYFVLVYPSMYYGSSSVQHSRFEDNIHGNPLAALVSGDFAVSIFFVLSGFVLSIGFFQSGKMSILKSLATRRYLRLMLPALASVIFAWLLIIAGLSYIEQAYAITQSSALNLLWITNTSLINALYEGTIGVFVQGSVYNYNSVLWTMKYEFLGSFIVFATAALFGKSRHRGLVYGFLFVALFNTWFVGFILGMIVADLFANKKSVLDKIKTPLAWLMVAVGIVLGGFPWNGVNETLYRYIQIPTFDTFQNQALLGAVGASLIIIAIFRINILERILGSKTMTKIGSYTYSLYLVHQPIIYTLGMAMFVVFVGDFSYSMSVLLAAFCLVPAIAFATYLFNRYVERPSMRVSVAFEMIMNGEGIASRPPLRALSSSYYAIKKSFVRDTRRSTKIVEAEIES